MNGIITKSSLCCFPNHVFTVVCHGSPDPSDLSLYTSPNDPQLVDEQNKGKAILTIQLQTSKL